MIQIIYLTVVLAEGMVLCPGQKAYIGAREPFQCLENKGDDIDHFRFDVRGDSWELIVGKNIKPCDGEPVS